MNSSRVAACAQGNDRPSRPIGPDAFLFTVNAIFLHDYPLAVEPGSTPRSLVQKKTWRDSLPIHMLLSAVSVFVAAQSSSEIPEGLMNNPVYGARNGAGTGFSPSTCAIPCHYHSPNAPYSSKCSCYRKDKRAKPWNLQTAVPFRKLWSICFISNGIYVDC